MTGIRKSNDPAWVLSEADAVLSNPPESLMNWLLKENLTWEDLSPKSEWENLRRLASNKVRSTAGLTARGRVRWATGVAQSMYERKIHESQKVCRMIAMHFSRAAYKLSAKGRLGVKKLEPGYTEEEWVLSHPGLVLSLDDPMVSDSCVKYELLNRCPGQNARNLLDHCSRDPQYRNDLYKSQRARKAKLEDAVAVKSPEVQACDDLEKLFLGLLSGGDDVWP